MLKESLIKLKTIVDSLEVRDESLKHDHNLFEKFFENFPVPICMWSVNKEGRVLSCRGNGFLNESAETEDELFLSDEDKCKIVDPKNEGTDDIKEMFIESDEKTYYVKVVLKRDGDEVVGSFGMGWDVTSNLTMLGSLTKIREAVLAGPNPDEEVLKWVDNAIGVSRMKSLIERMFI